jgi:hypothetical protein
MARSPRRELVLGHGRVFVDVPRLMGDDELVAVFEDFIAEVHGGLAERVQARREAAANAPKAPAEPPEPPKGSPLPAHSGEGDQAIRSNVIVVSGSSR